jgi:hypothetical protein
MDSVGPELEFRIDDISSGDPSATGVVWHLGKHSMSICQNVMQLFWSFSKKQEFHTGLIVKQSGEANSFHSARAAVSTDVILLKANDKLCMSSLLHL